MILNTRTCVIINENVCCMVGGYRAWINRKNSTLLVGAVSSSMHDKTREVDRQSWYFLYLYFKYIACLLIKWLVLEWFHGEMDNLPHFS